MPITQDRMISLIGAAQDYERALTRLSQIIEEQRSRALRGDITAELALESVYQNARPGLLLQFPLDTPAVLRVEALHFAKERHRNAKKAGKLRENRVAVGLGLPKPDRGDGGQHGWKGASRTPASISFNAKASLASTTGFIPAERPAAGPQLAEQGSWASKVQDPDLSGELLFEEASSFPAGSPLAEPEVAQPQYVPGELSPEVKAQIDREVADRARQAKAEEEFKAALGQGSKSDGQQ